MYNKGDKIKEHLVLVYLEAFEKGVEIGSGKNHASRIDSHSLFTLVFILS